MTRPAAPARRVSPAAGTGAQRHRALAICALAIAGLLGATVWLGSPQVAAAAWTADLSIDLGGGDGSGRVTSDDGAIDCVWSDGIQSGDCSEHYILPDFLDIYTVMLTLTPSASSYVCTDVCHEGGAPITRGYGFNADGESRTLSAEFRLKTYAIYVDIDGQGTLATLGDMTTCPVTPEPYEFCRRAKHGAQVSLLPKALDFGYWEGEPCQGETGACTFTVTREVNLVARFGWWDLGVDSGAGGRVCDENIPGTCVDPGDGVVHLLVEDGRAVTLGASPMAGYRFDGWSAGPCAGQDDTCAFTASADATIMATFAQLPSSTPTPKPTPTPTTKPAPTPTPRQSSRPTPAAAPTAAPAATGAGPTESGPATTAPGASPSAAPIATSGAVEVSSAPGPVASPAPGGSAGAVVGASDDPGAAPTTASAPVVSPGGPAVDLNPLLVVVGGLLLVLLAAVGFALVRRRRATRPPA